MPQPSRDAVLDQIHHAFRDAQFGPLPVGVCEFAPLRSRLIPCRAQARLPQNAQSVVVVLFPYHVGKQGNLSRYAIVPDYHGVVVPVLEQLAAQLEESFSPWQFRAFCDNSPIPEVRAAAMSGLGAMGDNGLLIHPEYGSWVFIGEIVTDAVLEPTGNGFAECLHCGRCRRHCPGNVLGDMPFDRTHCLSHITQKKGELRLEEAALIQKGGLAWGCDTCQEVCPLNRTARTTTILPFLTGALETVEKGDAFALPDRAYLWRGPKVIERNIQLLLDQPKDSCSQGL